MEEQIGYDAVKGEDWLVTTGFHAKGLEVAVIAMQRSLASVITTARGLRTCRGSASALAQVAEMSRRRDLPEFRTKGPAR